MRIETLKTTDLTTMMAAYNPRKISDHDMQSLRRSLRAYGIVEPVVVNRRSSVVVGGHQRIKAAILEGIAEMPVFYVDLDPQNERLLNLALNRIHGEWDEDLLEALMLELKTDDADVELAGFDESELERMTAEPPTVQPPSDFPEKDETLDTEHTCPKCGYKWSGGS